MELLNENRQRELLEQPESGMGYQAVDVILRDGERRRGTAFNAEYLLYSGEPAHRLQEITQPSRQRQMLERKELGLGEQILELKVVPNIARGPSRLRESDGKPATSSLSGANEGPEEELEEEEQFKRFSAFGNDRRVTANGALLPGTFATTATDAAQHIKTGSDAVKRYALPNPAPAVNEFTIDPPPRKTILKRGIAQPAYGQPGGGVEVIFVNGSPDKTVTGPKQIPP